MVLLLSLITILLSFSHAAVSEQTTDQQALLMKYHQATTVLDTQKACVYLKELTDQESFILHQLSLIRYQELCQPKGNWKKLDQKITQGLYRKSFIQSWFQAEFEKKNFIGAFRIYQDHPSFVDLDNREFDQMATQVLKAKGLKSKERRNLRRKLEQTSPRYIANPKKSQYLRVAKDFRRDRMFEKALFYYRKVINDPKRTVHERWNGFRGARITYKLERWSRMKKYILASKQWAYFLNKKYKWSKEMTRLHHDANIAYIRTLWTERGQTQAKKELLRLEKQLKGRYSLQQVYWLKGRMAEERGLYKEAVDFLDQAAKEKKISERDLERVLWALAWNQRRISQFKQSQQTIERLLKSPELTFFGKGKYLYWQAANYASMNQMDEAKSAFEDLAELDLYGYYGSLAYRWLKKPFPKPEINRISLQDQMDLVPPADRPLFSALVQVEEGEVAGDFVKKKVKTNPSWESSDWAKYLTLLQTAGSYKNFFMQYHRLDPKYQVSILEDYPHLLYPQPFKEDVLKASENTQVSSALIYSIMKQESGFDTKARSHADAFGLLQLIPQVARSIAKKNPSIEYQQPRDLYKPHIIIPLGASTLNELFKKFNSSFILSVASYNASERAVKGWVKSRFQGDPITFIEDIPYEETKGYVKLVMRNYIAYNRFNSSPDEKFFFPESCLEGLQSISK